MSSEIPYLTKTLRMNKGAAGDTDQVSFVNKEGCRLEIQSITNHPELTSATNGTNYATLTAAIDGGSAIGTRATSATSLTKNTEEDFTLSGDLVIPVNGVFQITKAVAGTGVAVDCTFEVVMKRVRS
jgi:hypothetical protein